MHSKTSNVRTLILAIIVPLISNGYLLTLMPMSHGILLSILVMVSKITIE